jgi:hypothetical protein
MPPLSERPGGRYIALPVGLYERESGQFTSCFLREADGRFRLRWHDREKGTWLQGAGKIAETLERAEGNALHYDIKLRGDFVCGTPEGFSGSNVLGEATVASADGLAPLDGAPPPATAAQVTELPKRKQKGKRAPSERGSTKKGSAPSSRTPTKAADSSAKAKKRDDAEVAPPNSQAAVVVQELRDRPYSFCETVRCPPQCEGLDAMRSWLAAAAGGELENEVGQARAAELRQAGFPFDYSALVGEAMPMELGADRTLLAAVSEE